MLSMRDTNMYSKKVMFWVGDTDDDWNWLSDQFLVALSISGNIYQKKKKKQIERV